MASSTAASILNLPNEIQLQIVDLLLDELSTNRDTQDPEAAWGIRHFDDVLCLPRDALLRVSKAHRDAEATIQNLAFSCTFYHRMLAPSIYKSIRMQNNEKSGSSIMALLQSQRSKYVEELRFFGSTHTDIEEDTDEDEDTGPDQDTNLDQDINLDPDTGPDQGAGPDTGPDQDPYCIPQDTTRTIKNSVRLALQNLHHFENLHILSVEFDGYGSDADEGNGDWDRMSPFSFKDTEDKQKVAEVEGRPSWRALMKETWDAISSVTQGHIRTLILPNLIPKEVSVFSTQHFSRFLNGIENFELYLLGGDAYGWTVAPMKGFRSFTSHLPEFFFNHLTAAKSITLDATYQGLIPIPPFLPGQSPHLRHLTLSGNIIRPELAPYLIDHKDILESATFLDCSVTDEWKSERYPWALLLNKWRSANPTKIQRLIVEPAVAPPLDGLPDPDSHSGSQSGSCGGRMPRALEMLLEDASERVISSQDLLYTYMDSQSGFSTPHPERRLYAILRRYDQEAFYRFMALCERNQRAAAEW